MSSYQNAGTANRKWSKIRMLTRLLLSVCLPLSIPFTRLHTNINELPGRYSCIGKNLALQELRCVTALLASTYDVTFPPGEDGRGVEEDTRDQFTSSPGELKVSFRTREKATD